MTRALIRPNRPFRGSFALTLAAVLTAGLVAAPSSADWLVMNDGARIETDGPWTERGRLVVFTDTDGSLVSMRLSEVDLDASRRVTAEMIEAATRPVPPPPPARPSVFRITDADVGHIDDDEFDSLTDPGDTGDAVAAEDDTADDGGGAPAASMVSVVAWERDDMPAGDGLEVRATLANEGEAVALDLSVAVTLFDEEGSVLASAPAQLAANALAPGQTTDIYVQFADVFDFIAVDFDVQHSSVETRSEEELPDLVDDFGDDDFGSEGDFATEG